MRGIRIPSHGTVVAYAALFASLGGTAFALERASVTKREIATGAVAPNEIRTGAVKRSEIKTGAVGSAEVRTDAVRAREIRAGAVGSTEVASDAVGQRAIADDAVGSDQLHAGAVGTGDLFDGAVTAPKLASNAVDGANVADASLRLADVAEVVTTVTFDPPIMNPGDCSSDGALAVPNKRAGDVALVMPGAESGSHSWNGELTLREYASTGDGLANTISVVLCRPFGTGPIDAGPQPLRVLLFR
jgi:hypothetical protein